MGSGKNGPLANNSAAAPVGVPAEPAALPHARLPRVRAVCRLEATHYA